MAMTLDSIYKPLNEFFLNRFKTDSESQVIFRFDKNGLPISDEDFIDPNMPGKYSPELAKEKFSDLVNNLPFEDSDKQNVSFTQDNIDEIYRNLLLGPSIPFIPKEITDNTIKDNISNSFNHIKAEALKIWDNIKLESITGLMFNFKPSLALPEDWYDKSKNELWTKQSFNITENNPTNDELSPKSQLWRLKINDETIKKILPVKKEVDVKPMILYKSIPILNKKLVAFPATFKKSNTAVLDHKIAPSKNINIRDHRTLTSSNTIKVTDHRTNTLNQTFSINNNLRKEIFKLDLKKRYFLNSYIKNASPTQPVKTNNISISFEFCIVNINRPWMENTFLQSKSWFIPGVLKGQLSDSASGGNLSLLPISFIAIRKLNIIANWSDFDVNNSKNAVDFGPFEISSGITNNTLSHEGIQIFAWLLQRMPDLPPNDSTT